MRCWPSSERTTNPSSRRKRQDSRSLSLVLFPPKPLRWVSAGALLGEVIKTPVLYFLHFCVGVVSLTLRLLWLCRNNPARGLFQQKKRLSQSGCSAPTDTLFPPAHSAFLALLCGGWYHYPRRALHAVETLDARGPRRHIRRFHAVPEFALCGLKIPSAGTHTTPAPNRAHSGSHGETRGGFPARDIGRVDRVNSLGTLCIVTFGTAQFDKPLSVAAAHHGGNTDFA